MNVERLKNCLTPDLLKKGWSGHCYIFAEAVWHLFGKDRGWKVKCYRDPGFETHWWVESCEGEIFDVLNDPEEKFPYHLGKGKGFLTREPSKRCLTLIERYKNTR